ncbi:4-(cytidine 5'-diphospho)-2-C-methyl-D-erythritol kinase [Spirulina subsalsa]|uniref:4-(cytidine 5'-diphospho)-2-C-methyl-D-erythritol kinase n=1 Tax=Spirulina subsalsa TaxID=54311 RepID=UPI00031D5CE3|nr:4-(cytidine 5'-diphospho)-2-C-methyl-D-erythritol kinase [Spirulina subsalsa]
MNRYTLLAPAKINLYLEIVGDRPDGFHELVMILQSIDLCDRITIQSSSLPLTRVRCNLPQLDEKQNLAYKAAQLMEKRFPHAFSNWGGVEIMVEKHIPLAAGLAGGSTDAAAVLVGLNLLWQLGLTQPELQDLGAELGSDVPFCVAGGTALATGRGEQLDPLHNPHGWWVVLGKYQSLEVSTPWAYQTYRQQFGETYLTEADQFHHRAAIVESGALVQAIAHNDGRGIAQHLHNDLEKVVLPQYPAVAHLRAAFAEAGVLGTMMSGSGPTVFALCESQNQAQQVKETIAQQIPNPDLGLWVTQFSSQGIHLA